MDLNYDANIFIGMDFSYVLLHSEYIMHLYNGTTGQLPTLSSAAALGKGNNSQDYDGHSSVHTVVIANIDVMNS